MGQLRRKMKDLIGLKNINMKTINGLKKEQDDLQKANTTLAKGHRKEVASLQEVKTTLEKKSKKDVFNHNCELCDLSESHKNQMSAIHDMTFMQRTWRKRMLRFLAPFFLPWNQVNLILRKSGQPFFRPWNFKIRTSLKR